MSLPVLWHIPVSHHNEKVRWALDLKGVEHERRAPTPPAHMVVARWLTRGRANTLPLLVLDGQAIADSTAYPTRMRESPFSSAACEKLEYTRSTRPASPHWFPAGSVVLRY